MNKLQNFPPAIQAEIKSLTPEAADAFRKAVAALALPIDQMDSFSWIHKGMTNTSCRFSCSGRDYILRLPGPGTGLLINRREEAAVYQALQGQNICDEVLFLDPDTGCKLSRFLPNARSANPRDPRDVKMVVDFLRRFHGLQLKVAHRFDLFEKIRFYEDLRNGIPSRYPDYPQTRAQVFSLAPYIRRHAAPEVLTHMDAVHDNFLFSEGGLRLVDWEYAAMQDPHVDLAMFVIYAGYTHPEIDRFIDQYFAGRCPRETRITIYCYISVCGMLWSNWCEYKHLFGMEYGQYSQMQYDYAREYSLLAAEALRNESL